MSTAIYNTVGGRLAIIATAINNCRANDNPEWERKHFARLSEIEDKLPSGSGIDAGVSVVIEKSSFRCLTLRFSYHHMNENGHYDGWTDHTLRARPTFNGLDITISGSNRNEIKDYLCNVFDDALSAQC